MKHRILCYGDSNTWGYCPDGINRYDKDTRWTGVMQQILGSGYEVIEEGFNGRTTGYSDPYDPGRNGKETLPMTLSLHAPLDLVIIMLGTNDLKSWFAASSTDIARNIGVLTKICVQHQLENDYNAKILVIAPPVIDEKTIAVVQEEFFGGTVKSARLSTAIKEEFADTNIPVIDAAELVKSSTVDGIHLEPESHAILARTIGDRVKCMLTGETA